jgi:hypothetical protein
MYEIYKISFTLTVCQLQAAGRLEIRNPEEYRI